MTSSSSSEASRQALRDLLDGRRDLDLSSDVYDESLYLQAHGGYSDVFRGRSRKHGVDVAIKRLRVHIMADKDVAKVGRKLLLLVSADP